MSKDEAYWKYDESDGTSDEVNGKTWVGFPMRAGSSGVEQRPFKPVVVGSIPTRRTKRIFDFVRGFSFYKPNPALGAGFVGAELLWTRPELNRHRRGDNPGGLTITFTGPFGSLLGIKTNTNPAIKGSLYLLSPRLDRDGPPG